MFVVVTVAVAVLLCEQLTHVLMEIDKGKSGRWKIVVSRSSEREIDAGTFCVIFIIVVVLVAVLGKRLTHIVKAGKGNTQWRVVLMRPRRPPQCCEGETFSFRSFVIVCKGLA